MYLCCFEIVHKNMKYLSHSYYAFFFSIIYSLSRCFKILFNGNSFLLNKILIIRKNLDIFPNERNIYLEDILYIHEHTHTHLKLKKTQIEQISMYHYICRYPIFIVPEKRRKSLSSRCTRYWVTACVWPRD